MLQETGKCEAVSCEAVGRNIERGKFVSRNSFGEEKPRGREGTVLEKRSREERCGLHVTRCIQHEDGACDNVLRDLAWGRCSYYYEDIMESPR
jgi:hypothetical protein